MDFNALPKRLLIIALLSFLTACAEDGGEKDSRVVISATDKITVLNILQYQLPIAVQVADSDGSPQANTKVKINLRTTGYYKGYYTFQDTDTSVPPDGKPDTWVYYTHDYTAHPPVAPPRTWCQAEDINNNIILDAGEDINGNGLLEPSTPTITDSTDNTPTLTPGTSTLVTDSNGFGYFSITYPKSEATWVSVILTATTQDGLSENRDEFEITLPALKTDFENEDYQAFQYSKYGYSVNCSDPF